MRSRKALYNIISDLILQVIIVVYGFIIPKIIISNFGSSVNGLISSITQFLAYITLLESGFGPVVKATLYKPIAEKDSKTIKNILKTTEVFFRAIAKIFIIYIIILMVVYPILVNNEFDTVYTMSLILIISISTFAEYFFGMTYRLYIQSEQKNYIISIIQIITYILSTIAIVVLVKFNCSIQIIKLVSGLIFVLRPILQNYYVKKKYNINLKDVKEGYELKQKWDGLAQHIASVIHSNTDITILTFFGNLAEISVYSVYYLVVAGIKKVIQVFSNGIDASWGDMIARNENENLNQKFNLYEVLYFSICTIVFACAMILIVPFVMVYTKDITDVNYSRPIFAILLVLSEMFCMVRLPYISITYAAGHFKQTQIGAWVEAIINIVLSVILVVKYGIIGVAIGTLVAMIIRTMEFVNYSSKNILKRKVSQAYKKITILLIEIILTIPLWIYVNKFVVINNYIEWITNAFFVFIIVTFEVGIINFICYKKELGNILDIIKIKIKVKK